jgi:predicted GNAT family N-acyltransferase
MDPIRYKTISDSREFAAVLKLRREIFIEEQGIPVHLEMDNLDEESTHIIALDFTGRCIGTGRLSIYSLEKGILSRIAVHKNYRKAGIGKEIIIRLEELAKEKKLVHLELKPHSYLEKFYKHLGYVKIQDAEKVGEHQLILMRKII